MRQFRESFFFKLVNKMDIAEDSTVFWCFKESFFLSLVNRFFCFTQELFSKVAHNSWFISKIDHFIFILISLLLISLTFASSKLIGLLVGLCFLVFLVKLCLKKGEKFSLNTFDVPIFIYISLVILSAGFSNLLLPAVKGVMKLAVYFASYLVFFNMLKNKPSWSYYLIGIIAVTAFAESLPAILQNFTGIEALANWQDKSYLNPEQLMTRVYGTLKPYNPNLLGGYLISAISCAAGMFFLFAYRKKFRLSIIFLAGFLSILSAIVFTGSRGAYLGLGAVLSAFVLVFGHVIWHDFPENRRLKKLWIYMVMLGVVGIVFLILTNPALQHRVASIFAFREDSSNSFRLNVYIASAKMFLDNWLTGIGPGNEVFRLTYGLYMKTGFDALAAYSVPLEIMVESGIFALFAFLWLIAAIFLKSAKTIINSKDIGQKILVSCCMISILGIMVHGLVDTIFFRPQIQMLFWMFTAILGANIGNPQKTERN